MKAKEITMGGVYLAKVSGSVVPVRVLAIEEHYYEKDRCRNEATGRDIVVKSPTRFRGPLR